MDRIWETTHTVEQAAVDAYGQDGCVTIRGALPSEALMQVRGEIRRAVRQHAAPALPLAQRNTYQRAFTQVTNLWQINQRIAQVACSARLAEMATVLMGCEGVRMYHDQALIKEAGGGATPWHCDQFYWPVDTDNTITAWIPLQDIALEQGPLSFARGSASYALGRGLSISDESESQLKAAMANYPYESTAFALGDVSFHSGWTYHHAGPNETNHDREAFTIIYIDKAATLTGLTTPFRQYDARTWCPGIKPGALINSPLNPILFEFTP